MSETFGSTMFSRLLLVAHQRLDKKHLEFINPKIDFEFNIACDELIMKLRAYIWSEKIGTKEIKYPRDWWQMFKCQYVFCSKGNWFLKRLRSWIYRRWPVRYETVTFTARVAFPDFKPSMPLGKIGRVIYTADMETNDE